MRILFNAIAKFISQGIASFADNFASRSNTTGGLGTSTSGHEWTPINGSINVQSGAAKAGSTPTYSSGGSAYPMSAVTMADSNVNIKLAGTNQGSTAAIWVQDSDEWWGVVSRATQTSTPGNTNYGYEYAAVGNSAVYNPSNTTNYKYDSSNTTNWGWGYAIAGYSYTATGYNIASYKYTSSTTTNYSTTYTKVAFFVYGFTSSTTYSANYGSKYNSKYAIAYNKYTWGTTNYGYVVNSTYYAYNSTTNSSTWFNYSGPNASTYGTNYGWTPNYTPEQQVVGSTTNYFWAVAGSTTNYIVNYVTNYGFAYGVTGTNATTYTVNQYVDIIQSTATAVNTISSSLVSTIATIGSMLVSLSNNQITTKAYSDTGFVTQIGSDLVYTATGAVVGTQFGIALSPSTYNQSDIIGTSVQIDVV